jgi:hypothetical protein
MHSIDGSSVDNWISLKNYTFSFISVLQLVFERTVFVYLSPVHILFILFTVFFLNIPLVRIISDNPWEHR